MVSVLPTIVFIKYRIVRPLGSPASSPGLQPPLTRRASSTGRPLAQHAETKNTIASDGEKRTIRPGIETPKKDGCAAGQRFDGAGKVLRLRSKNRSRLTRFSLSKG